MRFQIKTLAREKAAALNYKYAVDIYTQAQLMARGARSNASRRILSAIEERVRAYTLEVFTLRKEGSWDGTYADAGKQLSLRYYCNQHTTSWTGCALSHCQAHSNSRIGLSSTASESMGT